MKLHVLLASTLLLLPACAARRASPPPTPEPTSAPAASPPPTPGPMAAPPTGLQREAGPIGTPHPIVFQRAATDGRWVIACQAREDTDGNGALEVRFGQHGNTSGDALSPYLFLEPGAGERLDDFLTADPTDRYLVVVRGGSLRLLDTYKHTDTELAPPGAFPESTAPRAPLPVSFSRDGRRLLLVTLTGQEKRATAYLVNLEDGGRLEVPHGPGVLGHAELEPDGGRWAVFGVVTQDTNGDGQLTWPRARTSLSSRYCRGPIISYGRYGQEGDTATWLLRRVDGGEPVPAQGALQPLGDALLRQGEQGEVFLEQASGQRTEWVPASCRANVLHVDVAREQVLVSCTAQGNALELHGARVHQPLGFSVERSGRPPVSNGPPRLFPFTPTATPGGEPSPSVVDLETRTVHPLPGRVQYTEGTRALVTRPAGAGEERERLWLVDIQSGEQRELGEQTEYGLEVAGNLVYAQGLLVDMSTGRLVGPVEGELHALDTQGRVLLDQSQGQTAPQGPLQWTPAVRSR